MSPKQGIPIQSRHWHSDCTLPNQEITESTFAETKAKGSQVTGGIVKDRDNCSREGSGYTLHLSKVGWVFNFKLRTGKKRSKRNLNLPTKYHFQKQSVRE